VYFTETMAQTLVAKMVMVTMVHIMATSMETWIWVMLMAMKMAMKMQEIKMVTTTAITTMAI